MESYQHMSDYALAREWKMVFDYCQLHKEGIKLAQRNNHNPLAHHHKDQLIEKEAYLEKLSTEMAGRRSFKAGSVSDFGENAPTTTGTNNQKS